MDVHCNPIHQIKGDLNGLTVCMLARINCIFSTAVPMTHKILPVFGDFHVLLEISNHFKCKNKLMYIPFYVSHPFTTSHQLSNHIYT